MRDACNGGRVEAVQRGCTWLGVATYGCRRSKVAKDR